MNKREFLKVIWKNFPLVTKSKTEAWNLIENENVGISEIC